MEHQPFPPALAALGWTVERANQLQQMGNPDWIPGRIVVEHRDRYRLLDGETEHQAVVSGRFRHAAQAAADFPVVGDWVVFERPSAPGPVVIQQVMPRQHVFARQMAGGGSAGQVLASNLDTLLIASSCNADWNLHRIERCLALAYAGGIRPVVLLTKLDLIDDPKPLLEAARTHVGEVPVVAVSARTGEGLEQLKPYLSEGQTLALVGSSGVGKSTLVNRLTDSALMEVREIREDDDRGRHTTTHRQLVRLARGAMLIDTPGIREVGMYDAEAGVAATFGDIEELARECRFTDCQHEAEPGCAVRAALAAGRMDRDRIEHYQQLLRENAYQARREDVRLQQEQKRRDKEMHRRQKDMYRTRKKGRK